jgi:uncharacterized protein (TIRG00374 family)
MAEGPVPAGPEDFPPAPRLRDLPQVRRRSIWPRIVAFVVTAIVLYILWPSLLTIFQAWPELLTINPIWFVVMLGFEVGSFISIWALERLAIRTDRWFGVATAQLAGNAVSRIVPGGAAAGGAVQYRMLTDTGIPPARVATGLTASGLIGSGTLFALPILAVPAMLLGRPTPHGLAQAAVLGGVVFVLGFIAGWILLTREGALRTVALAIQWTLNHIRRRRSPVTDLPDRLQVERNEIAATLGSRWWQALVFALGNWLFDYLALLAALTAIGAHPRPTLVLLAYAGAMVLSMIPITPGGLGFVEAGLAGLLALAGVPAPALATLAYRLVSYWLPLPVGAVAAGLHRRRYAHRSATA